MNISMRSKTWLDTKGLLTAISKSAIERLPGCAMMVERTAKESMTGGGGGGISRRGAQSSPPGMPPMVRSGILRSSIRHAQHSKVCYLIGPTKLVWYGRAQEFGAVITPKSAKALTVPISEHAYGKKARDFGKLVMIERPGKPPLLMEPETGEILFVLVKKVIIPARPFMRPALYNSASKFPNEFRGMRLAAHMPRSRGLLL